MKVATRRLLEEQLVIIAIIGSSKKSDAMWHVRQRVGILRGNAQIIIFLSKSTGMKFASFVGMH